MKQLTQKLSNGEILVQEVPEPVVGKGMVLVKNHYSLISPGTEGNTATTARKSLIGKAKERPQQVKQVLEVLTQQGPVQTYRTVTKKLEAYSPLGYSSAGEIIAVGEAVTQFKTGDLVACAGVGYANHAEIITVPVNLCVKLPENAKLKAASYNTLGAIALQSIRQADLRLGETCAIIGLGLLGQLTGLMLKASGVNVIGIDVSEQPVKLAQQHFAGLALTRNIPGIENQIAEYTNGLGVDAVIIAAATTSTDPINFAGTISRKKGKVVILGAVPTGFKREPHWYKKELQLLMSCSYGPGRYDINYEEKGIDYPAAYVRWTEKRNMEAFQQLLASKRIDIGYITTHEMPLEDAPKAYDMIVNKTEPYIGIVLKYDTAKPVELNKKITVGQPKPASKVNIGFIGAGSYAQGNLLPNIPKNNNDIVCKGVLTNTGTTSKRVAERFRFEFCTSNENDILENPDINTLFIATRHDSHAEYVIKGLKNGKHIFVEKPLCLTPAELELIINKQSSTNNQQLMVGFNRRFSSLSTALKKHMGNGPMSMIYRINAGHISADTWIQDMEIGGGRIIGEACHFIDYLTWLNGSLPISVYASALPDTGGHNDTVNINITFANGSTGVVAYYANGPKSMNKEYIEVFYNGFSGIISNFKELRLFGKTKQKKKLINVDKGQKQMVEQFLQSILDGKSLIPFEEIVAVTKATFAVLESIKTGQIVKIK
ncbi:MAG: bi-domain-containing oxidoreductase [Lentimicrobiaceae bacterium]|nr:bi-domain-containing oxidoreductase [Lentimicrobiaceae bacterium]